MTYKTKPENFSPRFAIAGCFVEHSGKIILLRRHEHKSQGGRWGLPAGKVEQGEGPKKAVVREIKEETGVDILEDKISYFGETFHRHGDYDLSFHMFSAKLDFLPEVRINTYEHKEFAWRTPSEVLAMGKDEVVEDLRDTCALFVKLQSVMPA